METTQEAVDKLAAVTDVADWMERHGYKGFPFASDSCIVAQYLRDRTGVRHSCWSHYAQPLASDRTAVTLPDHIASFMQAFDRGDYPHLMLP